MFWIWTLGLVTKITSNSSSLFKSLFALNKNIRAVIDRLFWGRYVDTMLTGNSSWLLGYSWLGDVSIVVFSAFIPISHDFRVMEDAQFVLI